MNYLFTSESVSEGHPDKVADQISDAILDALLEQDIRARVACETLVTTGMVLLSGEITSQANIDYPGVARQTIREIGYDSSEMGFDADSCSVLLSIDKQSPDIAQGVNEGEGIDLDQGAGDQGIMFGYACKETDVLMPFPITYSHRLVKKQAEVRKSGQLPWLRPDAKSQVSVLYEDGEPVAVDTIILSTQHDADVSHADVTEAVIEEIIKPVLPAQMLSAKTRYLVNPTGRFVIGGPVGDTGLTGRKIIVDTYGGIAHHGGWRIFRQGPFQGGPLRRVRGAQRRQAYRRRRSGRQVRDPGSLCHRRRQAGQPDGQYLRHRRHPGNPARIRHTGNYSIYAPKPSSGNWTCCGPSTDRPRPTAISAARKRTSPGRLRTRWSS